MSNARALADLLWDSDAASPATMLGARAPAQVAPPAPSSDFVREWLVRHGLPRSTALGHGASEAETLALLRVLSDIIASADAREHEHARVREALAAAEHTVELRASEMDRAAAKYAALERRTAQLQQQLDAARTELKRVGAARDEALVAAKRASSQAVLTENKLMHLLKKETDARTKAEELVRRSLKCSDVPRPAAHAARAELKQRIAYQEEALAAASDTENAQLRARFQWIAQELQAIAGSPDRSCNDMWQLEMSDFDQVVVPHVRALLGQVRAIHGNIAATSCPAVEPPVSVAPAQPLHNNSDSRRAVRVLRDENAQLQGRVAELEQRLSHCDQMLDYSMATATTTAPLIKTAPPLPKTAPLPVPALQQQPPLRSSDNNGQRDARENELLDFLATLSP